MPQNFKEFQKSPEYNFKLHLFDVIIICCLSFCNLIYKLIEPSDGLASILILNIIVEEIGREDFHFGVIPIEELKMFK